MNKIEKNEDFITEIISINSTDDIREIIEKIVSSKAERVIVQRKGSGLFTEFLKSSTTTKEQRDCIFCCAPSRLKDLLEFI